MHLSGANDSTEDEETELRFRLDASASGLRWCGTAQFYGQFLWSTDVRDGTSAGSWLAFPR